MADTKITLVQIDNYGPWTVTPTPRREADLQTLQSRLYADLAQLFGTRGGYVFFTRFDNMVAVTNGIDDDTHALIQESIGNRYPVTLSLSIATGRTPAAALADASTRLQAAGSAQDERRREILRGDAPSGGDPGSTDVQIAHFDVIDATQKFTDRHDAFASFIRIEHGYFELMRYLYQEHESLTFFVGGDNMITVGADLDAEPYADAIEHVAESAGIDLRVGVGHGETAQAAGMDAKHALERCRRDGTHVEHVTATPD